MAQNTSDNQATSSDEDAPHSISLEAFSPDRPVGGEASWAQIWHLPLLILGLVLMTLGVIMALPDGPKNDFPRQLNNVEGFIQARNWDEAEARLVKLDEQIHQAVDATQEDQGRFWQLWADLQYLKNQKYFAVLREEALQKIVSDYRRAQEHLAGGLGDGSQQRLARALVALGREGEALKIVDELKGAPPSQRYGIIKSLIEYHNRRGKRGRPKTLVHLVERFKHELVGETDPNLRFKEEVWLVQLEATRRLDASDTGGTIDYLLKRLLRLEDVKYTEEEPSKAVVLAPLYVTLAHAYREADEFDNAQRQYNFAQKKIKKSAALHADILVGLGKVSLARSGQSNIEEALAYFSIARRDYPSEQPYIDALIGAGDCEARLSSYPDALGLFLEAANRLGQSTLSSDPRRQDLMRVVGSHLDHAFEKNDFELALNLLGLLKPLYDPDLPPSLLLSFAKTNQYVAEDYLARAQRFDPRKTGKNDPDDMRAFNTYNRDAAGYFERAADYYRQHARAVSRSSDDQAHSDSLWKSATSYDKAQQWDMAIDVYIEFVTTRPDDPKRLEAKKNLGIAYMSITDPRPQYKAAIEQFEDLMRHHPKSPQTMDSRVPMARALAGIGKQNRAVGILRRIVNDHPVIRPDSLQYREALISLGKLLYQRIDQDSKSAEAAIEQLKMAVDRYGDDEDGAHLRFLLADAYRKSIPALEEGLAQRRSHQEQVALGAERKGRLDQARMYYNQTINMLEARPQITLSPLENLYLRNSYFYQADCAYDNGQFETAIDLYDQAARRWESHPASLVALVQIFNAYCELDQFSQARAANARASGQLERIPDEAFDDPSLPMRRQNWEDWTRWRNELNLSANGDS